MKDMMPSLAPCLHFTLLVLFILTVYTTASTTSSYESVRTLDKYGNAIQLQHATAAADRHGRLVIALVRDKQQTIWIVSCTPPHPAYHRRRLLTNEGEIIESDPVVHSLTTASSPTCIVCSGIQGDALQLIRYVQKYGRNIWERYDNYLSARAAAHAVSVLKRSFWGYPDHGFQGKAMTEKKDKDHSWSRPLGVRTLVLSANHKDVPIQLIDPSGISSATRNDSPTVVCLGKDGLSVESKLMDLLSENDMDGVSRMSDTELEEIIWNALESVLTNPPMKLLLEEISEKGITRRYMFRGIMEHSSS